jgi:hypothetical protein
MMATARGPIFSISCWRRAAYTFAVAALMAHPLYA